MKITFNSLPAVMLAGLLLVGCATKQADSCCAPMAGMSGMAAMKPVEYEYKTVRIKSDYNSELNEASKGGWKLVAFSSEASTVIFERPKQ
jgi:carbohydrate-selective porin OprB